MSDPTQPVPGPTREQIREAIVSGWDDPDNMAAAVAALLPASPSPTDDDPEQQ